MPKCKDIVRLVLEGEDRKLRVPERLALRMHLVICTNCTRFAAQVGLMRGALTRWRGYRDERPE